ncbi:MAG: hypothetical protein ACETWG_09595, partial [Candidatus Neomarinimicrobiota bacterium]
MAVLYAQPAQHLNSDILNLQLLSDADFVALESLLDNPLSLNNTVSADFWFLEDSLAGVVLAARQSGPFTSWEDVARRTHLPGASIQSLRQFFYLPPDRGVAAQMSARIATAGTDERIRTRLNLNGGQWSAQWAVQRDPGEYRLADLSDLSVTIQKGRTQLALGAHRLIWGLGLVLAEEFAAPRGETLLRPTTRLIQLRPGYSNTNTGVLRGASIHAQRGRFQFVAGTSIQRVDITAEPDGTPRVVDYRTHTRLGATTAENVTYLAGTTSLVGWKLGGLASWYSLQSTAETSGSQRQDFSLVAMRSFHSPLGELHASHEEAIQLYPYKEPWQPTGRASQTRLTFIGSRSPKNEQLRLALLQRRYPPEWVPLRGRLVGEAVSRGNESGWFIGWRWNQRYVKLSGYLDSYCQVKSQSADTWPYEGWQSGLGIKIMKRPIEASLYYRTQEEVASTSTLNNAGLEIIQQRVAILHYAKFGLNYTRSSNFSARIIAALKASEVGYKPGQGETFGVSLRYRFRSDVTFTLGA